MEYTNISAQLIKPKIHCRVLLLYFSPFVSDIGEGVEKDSLKAIIYMKSIQLSSYIQSIITTANIHNLFFFSPRVN